MENPEFLKKKYDLHKSEEVESAAKRTEVSTGEKIPQKPQERIQNYLDRFNEIIKREDPEKKNRGIKALKKVLDDKFVIKEDAIPERYYENQERLRRERGHDDVEISSEEREQLAEVVIADQKSTLNNWIDYLSSNDATYPDWLKYWAFRSIIKLSTYDKEEHKFNKRKKDTTAPFPDINREALAYVLDGVIKKHDKEDGGLNNLDEDKGKEWQKLLSQENFGKLYAFAIEEVTPASKEAIINVEGEWKKYDQGEDHMPLVESLQGHGTGWCTAGESTAKTQLEGGDFYVYYSLDTEGNSTIPRVAIRMEDDSIGEVRGIAPEQNLDPYINDVVKEKLQGFPDGDLFTKKTADMKTLTEIDNRVKDGEEMSKADLIFLYEIEKKIEGFGYSRDPRIDEILVWRNKKSDIAFALNMSTEKVSITKEEALSGDVLYHYGSFDLSNLTSTEGFTFPQSMKGDLYLNGLTSAEGLTFPDPMKGNISLNGLTSAEGLTFPESIWGNLYLSGLTSAEGLTLPQSMYGDLYLSNLTSAEGLTLPQSMYGDLYLNGLTSVKGLTLPDPMKGSTSLNGLTSAEGLILPQSMKGSTSLNGLTSAEGLILPKSMEGYLDLNGLTSTEGLNLPESMEGVVYFGNLNLEEKEKLREQYPQLEII